MSDKMQERPISNEQMKLFVDVLDAIIPRCEVRGLPGAGEVGLGDVLCEEATDFIPILVPSLVSLREEMKRQAIANWGSVSDAQKRSLLEAVAIAQPSFLPALLFQVFSRYYQHPRVLEALGMEGRPPYPLGYDLEAGDLRLLDAVKRRAPLFRDVP